jgi:hypothetical protein
MVSRYVGGLPSSRFSFIESYRAEGGAPTLIIMFQFKPKDSSLNRDGLF